MSHDRIKADARRRMAKTGEPYQVARREVIKEHKAAQHQIPVPDISEAHRQLAAVADAMLPDISEAQRQLMEGGLVSFPKMPDTSSMFPKMPDISAMFPKMPDTSSMFPKMPDISAMFPKWA